MFRPATRFVFFLLICGCSSSWSVGVIGNDRNFNGSKTKTILYGSCVKDEDCKNDLICYKEDANYVGRCGSVSNN
jgi:hypothetical protein